jgi:hypothetical protein
MDPRWRIKIMFFYLTLEGALVLVRRKFCGKKNEKSKMAAGSGKTF